MLVLVSFVLVLAAAVTLVVGLLQSGLTLIYLSIACSVLAGVVLAVAVLRGRPEPRPAAAGRSFTPPARQEQVPASVGAPAAGADSTASWSAPTATAPAPPSAPPSPPPPRPTSGGDDATKAASTALLGRLRGKRAQTEGAGAAPEAPPEPVPVPAPAAVDTAPATVDETMEVPVVGGDEDDDGFPIADYDRLRATELLSRLPALDRNQLEAVRQRESSGKNRFTVMSRVDSLLAAQQDPAWQVEDEEWETGVGTDAESEAVAIEAEALQEEEDFGAALEEQEDYAALEEQEDYAAVGEIGDDEVDQMAAPAGGFPIAGYESLTVGQILPRLSDLDADELAQVRAREQEGRARGTILDRIDRLAAKSGAGAVAMPAAAPARKAPARKARAARRTPAVEVPPVPAPAPAAKKTRARKAPVAAAPPVEAPVKKARARKAAAPPVEAAAIPLPPPESTPPARKVPARARKAAAPIPVPPASTPMQEAVKKARAKKAPAPAKKTTKRP